MELIFRISLFIAGVINLLPSILTFFPKKIAKSYGVGEPNSNQELLLRHRAAMFGMIGGLMIFAAISQKCYEIATFIGFFSMISFVLLYFLIGKNNINQALKKVMLIDLVAIGILAIGFGLYYYS